MKITCLIDNATFQNGVYAQQGLSLLIETNGKRILFDTGQSYETLKHNAEILKVDIQNLDIIVVSHKDFDHLGGLPGLVKNLDSQPDIYLIDDYAEKGKSLNKLIKEEDWSIVANYPKLHEITNATKIDSNIYLTKPKQTNIKEIALVLDSPEGAVVFVGCSHPGIDVMLESAKETINNRKIRGVIGGFHLILADEAQIQEKIDYLKDSNLEFITCLHCTGYRAISKLFQTLPNILKENVLGTFGVGNVIEINPNYQMTTKLGVIK